MLPYLAVLRFPRLHASAGDSACPGRFFQEAFGRARRGLSLMRRAAGDASCLRRRGNRVPPFARAAPARRNERKKSERRAATLGGRSVRITEEIVFAWGRWVKFLRRETSPRWVLKGEGSQAAGQGVVGSLHRELTASCLPSSGSIVMVLFCILGNLWLEDSFKGKH